MKVIPPITLPPGLQPFSRASAATYVGADGLIKTAAVNEPRIDNDPVTGEMRGLLVEGASTNLLTNSDIEGAVGSVPTSMSGQFGVGSGQSAVVSVDYAIGPNGKSCKHTRGSLGDSNCGYFALTASAGIYSVFVHCFVPMDSVAESAVISAEVFGVAGAGNLDMGIRGVWQKVSFQVTNGNAAITEIPLVLRINGQGGIIYTDAWQGEAGPTPTSYIPTTTAPVTRAADVIAPAGLLSTTLTETYAPWSSTATYAVGDRRVFGVSIYESLVASNTNNPPDTSPTKWLLYGPSNTWALFDLLRNSQSTATDTITVAVKPGQRVDAIALMGLDADSVTVTMQSGGQMVYRYTQALQLRRTNTWLQYFFGRFRYRKSVIKFDLPPYSDGVITVSLSSARGSVKCGAMVLGQAQFLGSTLVDPESDRLTFSSVDRDEFGNAKLNKVGTSPKTTQTVYMPAALVPAVEELRADLDSTPAVWSGLDDQSDNSYFESLLILGIYRSWPIRMQGATRALATITLEEI